MPFIHIRHSRPEPLSAEAAARLGAEATRAIADLMGKRPDLTAVLVEPVPASGWLIAGQPVDRAARLDAYVTAGTNTEAEKAAFLAEAMTLLDRHLGPLSPVTYAMVHELPAENWGYGGLTQAARRPSATPPSAQKESR